MSDIDTAAADSLKVLDPERPIREAGVVAACCWAGGLVLGAIGIYVHQLWLMWLGSGVIGGIGLGLGYISPVSTLIKWFPDHRGMATGMAIAGFGGGTMIGAPLANLLMNYFKTSTSVGAWQTFLVMGVIYFFFMMVGAFRYRLPPDGWRPDGWTPPSETRTMIAQHQVHLRDAHKTPQFWLIWWVLCLNVSAGIGIIGMARLMLASPDQQISLTDPDSRSMATSGRGSGVVGYNVQVAVDTEHHLIVTHEVTNDGSDRAQLANIACRAKEVLGVDELEAVADRGYYSSEEILTCHQAAITITLPEPITSGIEAKGRFGKQDFVYLSDEDMYRCPAGEKLVYHFTNEENGLVLRRYWTNACQSCAIKQRCTTGKERRITRWEHEHLLEAVQKRLDNNPHAMRQRRETAEHPFGTLKMRMGATHFLMKRLSKVATEMALHVLAYNLTRVMNIIGIRPLIAAIRA